MRFSIIEDSAAILFSKGNYRQCDLYSREGGIYAKWGSSFVRLYKNGTTSADKVRWEAVEYDQPEFDKFGRMCTIGNGFKEPEPEAEAAKEIEPKARPKTVLRAIS